jgi:transposase InsO family protein
MKKEEIRKEFFKLRIKHHSYSQCRRILKAKYGYEITIRTLQRWNKRLNETKWDLKDSSRKPKTVYHKITPEIEKRVVSIRKRTGWGENKIANFLPGFSHKSINKILNKYKLCDKSKRRKKRIKYIRWQRKHPNSLWQVDISDQKIKAKYCLSVIDDCSRYSLALAPLNRVTTVVVIKILDDLIKIHGKPREILTDNGSVFGGRSKHSKFDRWCRKRRIEHIRTAIHSPTTVGKVERLFQTMAKEMPFCNNDSELFRMRYNHFRPHTSLENKSPSEIYFRG